MSGTTRPHPDPTASATAIPAVFTVPQAAERASVSTWTIRKEIREGRLRAVRIGRVLRVLDEDLVAWMRNARGEAEPWAST